MGGWLEFLSGPLLGDDRTLFGFHGHGCNRLALGILDEPGNAGEGAPGSHARDNHIHGAVGVGPDFRPGGEFMDRRVGRILELLGEEELGRIGRGDLFGAIDRPFHPFRAWRKHQIGPEGCQHAPALNAHGLGHGEGELVASCRRDIGQRDAGVAAGGLNDFDAGFEDAAFFGIPDQVGPDTAFDGIGRVAAFDFGQYGRLGALGDFVQTDQRGVPDGL